MSIIVQKKSIVKFDENSTYAVDESDPTMSLS